MSSNAHKKSTYQLRRLPQCSKCKVEFVLVYSRYELKEGLYKEWECPKCHKIVPVETLKEGPSLEQDSALHRWCKAEFQRRKKRN